MKFYYSKVYGPCQENLIQILSKILFSKDQNPKPGMVVQVMDHNGHALVASIKNVENEHNIIDLNHQLAGKILNFRIKIIETGYEPDLPHSCGCGFSHDHNQY